VIISNTISKCTMKSITRSCCINHINFKCRQIAENSGVDGGVVVFQMRTGKGNYGFDASQNKYVDLVEAGIIDPTKVVRTALENAVSVASLLLLTEATMTDVPKNSKTNRHPMEEAAND